MWKVEFKRYFFDKKTLMIYLVLFFLGLLSFYVSYNDKQMFVDILSMNYEDIDTKKMEVLIADYNGIKFVLDFLLTSDFIQLFLIVFFIYFGVFLSPTLQTMISTGQENFIISRISYREHVKVLLISQTIYISLILCSTISVLAVIGYIWGGVGSGVTGIGQYDINFGWFVLICILQILIIILFSTFVNAICLLSNIIIKNKVVIQSLSFGLFIIFPMIISSTVGNIITMIGNIAGNFVPFTGISSIYWLLQYRFEISYLVVTFIPFIVYGFVLSYIYNRNVAKYSVNCL